MYYSACIPALFRGMPIYEALPFVREAGLDHYEFWMWKGQDIDAIAKVQKELALTPAALCTTEFALTDPAKREAFIEGIAQTIPVCHALGCKKIITQVGAELSHLSRQEQHESIVAGLKAVGESVKQPLRYYRNNIDSTLTLLEVMSEYGVKRLIFSSSATVYGTPRTFPITEDMPTGGCTNPYGQTKFMIEQILTDACVADPELSVVLLRYFNPIGAHESGMLLEDPNGIPNNLMPYILQVAAGRRPHLNVFGNDYDTPDGTGVRDYIHVCDLAEGHVLAVRYAAEHVGAEAINLGTGVGYSVLDVVHTFESTCGVAIPTVIAPRRAGDIATNYACPDKALSLLGWQAKRNLADMCRDSWNAQKRNPGGYEDQ